jgi:hypothetical protein
MAEIAWEQVHTNGWRCLAHWPIVAGISRRRFGYRKPRIEWQWHVSRGYEPLRSGIVKTKAEAFTAAETTLRRLAPEFTPEDSNQ